MPTLTYRIGADRRAYVKDVQNFKIDFSDSNNNWVQARQYERGLRQVFVNVQNEDGSPFDLTGCNYWFEGKLPDKVHKVIDAKHGVPIDPSNGQFRFDMPAQAFAVAGSYEQAFFRIMRGGQNVSTLEFDMEVLKDKVISGLIPRDYVTPFEDILDQIEDKQDQADSKTQAWLVDYKAKLEKVYQNFSTLLDDTSGKADQAVADWQTKFDTAFQKLEQRYSDADSDIKDQMTKWQQQVTSLITDLNSDYASMQLTVNGLNEKLDSIDKKADEKDLVTQKQLDDYIATNAQTQLGGTYQLDLSGISSSDFPRFRVYLYQYGAGIPQPDPGFFGVKQTNEVALQPQFSGEKVKFLLSHAQVKKYLDDFDATKLTTTYSSDKRWLYLTSGVSTVGIQCINAKFK